MIRTVIAATALMFFALAISAPADAAMPRPTVEHITYGPCPHQFKTSTGGPMSVDGCAFPDGRVYIVQRGDRLALAHERGHLVWTQILTPGDRAWFARHTGTPTTAADDEERVADAYMTCRLRMLPDGTGREVNGMAWQTTAGYDPSMRQHARVCAAFERVAAR